MKIGGLQPVTLLDYPQKLAAIVFTAGCNMRCPFCYNSKLVLPELLSDANLYKEDEVIEFLKKRKKYLDGLVITGGEPLLQEDLADFLRKMKAVGYEIKLDTNGLQSEKLKDLLEEKLVDYIAMDIKGPLESYEKFSGVSAGQVANSIKIIMKSGLPYEFRSTVVKGLHSKEDITAMAKTIKGAKLYYLQNYMASTPLAGDKFKGKEFFLKDMEDMRQIAGQYVKKCLIR
ncbi:MAG: anaerobic ribonucleoside-triphosphate reductase activating protein [Candidatus Buchananbacteria bacterium]|jgi:pyruvate formate lyase activating enzyme